MPWGKLETAAMSRALAAIADRPGDHADIFCERRIEAEWPAVDETCGVRVRREEGLAVRLLRGGRSWIASRDGLSGADLAEALRSVARAQPPASAAPELEVGAALALPESLVAAVRSFAGEVERALRRHHVAFPMRFATRWHRRELQVVGTRWVPAPEREAFFSYTAELPWGRCGGLATELGAAEAERVATRLVARFRAREAPRPEPGPTPLWFAPAASAVLLHEAIAHALEVDLLARGGRPESAIGLALGPPEIDVLDDPRRAPRGVERATDDEGQPVARRWLLRAGKVDQPLADLASAADSERLLPGSGFRGGRHEPPLPRVHHLELAAPGVGERALATATEGGIYVPEIDAGRLDPASGRFELDVPAGRRLEGGAFGAPVGWFRLRGSVAGLLASVVGVGNDARPAGAGWCAKGGRRRAVWATVPSLALAGLEVVP
jgi:predicted Zn-dependent protease